ncbi:IS66-like element accessory protein TnpA [Methylorubrum aminovorans]
MRVEVLEGIERRRRWSFEDKARIVEASYEAGVSVCSVARRNGIAQGLLFTWRRQARQGRLGGDEQAPVFVPVAITREPSSAVLNRAGFPGGHLVWVRRPRLVPQSEQSSALRPRREVRCRSVRASGGC